LIHRHLHAWERFHQRPCLLHREALDRVGVLRHVVGDARGRDRDAPADEKPFSRRLGPEVIRAIRPQQLRESRRGVTCSAVETFDQGLGRRGLERADAGEIEVATTCWIQPLSMSSHQCLGRVGVEGLEAGEAKPESSSSRQRGGGCGVEGEEARKEKLTNGSPTAHQRACRIGIKGGQAGEGEAAKVFPVPQGLGGIDVDGSQAGQVKSVHTTSHQRPCSLGVERAEP
jgi:hypothetical protein